MVTAVNACRRQILQKWFSNKFAMRIFCSTLPLRRCHTNASDSASRAVLVKGNHQLVVSAARVYLKGVLKCCFECAARR